MQFNINEPPRLQSRPRRLEAICLLGWICRGQQEEERRKSQRIAEPGQFIPDYHCLLDSESWLPRLSSVMRTALRSGVLLQSGNNKSRIFSFALRNCDLELPMEQCNSSAISRCWYPSTS